MSKNTHTNRTEFPAHVAKSELAAALNISVSSLQMWLNRRWINELTALGYKPESKIVSRRILIFLQEKIALLPEDFE